MKAGGTRLEDLKGEAPIAVAPGPLTGLDWFMEEGSAIMQRVRDILDKVDQRLLAEKNLDAIDKTLADLEGAMAAARSFAEGLPSLLDRGNETGLHAMVMQPLNDLLVNANRSLDELRDHLLKTTLKQADDLILSAKDAVQDARTAIQRVDAILVEGNPKIQAILDDLVKTADGLDGRIQSVQDQLNGLLGDGRDALAEARPEIIETLQSLRRTMWEVEMAARKVRANPAVILWGDDEPVLDVLPVDESGVQRTGRARPFGQRDDK